MDNPYRILGVSENAGEEEIKEAYLKLAKKYHPDKYKDNPLADLAAEKMKEINAAYDAITTQRKKGFSGTGSAAGHNYSNNQGGSRGNPFYINIRSLIDRNMLDRAMAELQNNPTREAEWYFLSGCICLRKGAYSQAYENFRIACNMEPDNFEYNQAFARMNNAGGQYRNMGSQTDCNQGCNCCSQLICADCCCECMGGDLISCC